MSLGEPSSTLLSIINLHVLHADTIYLTVMMSVHTSVMIKITTYKTDVQHQLSYILKHMETLEGPNIDKCATSYKVKIFIDVS